MLLTGLLESLAAIQRNIFPNADILQFYQFEMNPVPTATFEHIAKQTKKNQISDDTKKAPKAVTDGGLTKMLLYCQ